MKYRSKILLNERLSSQRRRKIKTLAIHLIMAGLLIAGCSVIAKNGSKNGPVEFKLIAEGQHSQIDTASVFLIDNARQWAEIWGIAYANVEPMPELPPIDFAKSMILAAFMGQKNSGGYKIEIAAIQLRGDTLNVEITNYARGGGMMLPVLTSPFEMVEVPKGKCYLNIMHIEKKE